MKFETLQQFISCCQHNGVDIPEGLEVTIEDYENIVPEEHTEQGAIEYNHLSDCKQFSSRVQIISAKKVELGFDTIRAMKLS